MGPEIQDQRNDKQLQHDLVDAIEEGSQERATQLVESLEPGQFSLLFTRLGAAEQDRLAELLPSDVLARNVETLPETEAKELLERMESPAAARMVSELSSDEQADLIGSLDVEEAEKILDEMSDDAAELTRELIAYPTDCAGGLMIKEYLSYPASATVGDVIGDMRANAGKYKSYDVQYAYVVNDEKALLGVLRLRDLLLAADGRLASDLMIQTPKTVSVVDDLERLEKFFSLNPFYGAPVLDEREMLVGVVRQADVEEAVSNQATKSFLRYMGIIGGEELRTMPLRVRSTRRLGWLSINIVLNLIAASIIAFNQDTLEAVIALAVFLPIISDMSGCSGNQAVAVSMRELALGLVRPREMFRVLMKEGVVGVVNGTVLGFLLGGLAYIWKGNVMLGVVVGSALALNTLTAVCLGGSIPLVLRRFKQDPALASGPILTTVTDMCGFLLVLTFARLALGYL